jgi:hypothetical protein
LPVEVVRQLDPDNDDDEAGVAEGSSQGADRETLVVAAGEAARQGAAQRQGGEAAPHEENLRGAFPESGREQSLRDGLLNCRSAQGKMCGSSLCANRWG